MSSKNRFNRGSALSEMSALSHLVCILALTSRGGFALLMSELPTPSLVLDMKILQRHVDSGKKSSPIPRLELSNNQGVLCPCKAFAQTSIDPDAPPIRLLDAHAKEPFCYFHTTVIRSREDALKGKDDPVSTFLVEIDLVPELCGSSGAQLVLGLNNHHVGSYYWARSTGSGASMEAPGVLLDISDGKRGIMRWEKPGGPIECNSNDGKRSEWANFLRRGDTVQLLPFNVEEAILSAVKTDRIFGVSSKDRPLGSEPEVICQWSLQ